MATIKYTLKKNQQLTSDQQTEIENAAKLPITFDEDAPELTAEQIATFSRLARQQRKSKKLA